MLGFVHIWRRGRKGRGGGRGRAFTLIETMLTTIIVGVAITALVKLVLTMTVQNVASQRMTTGIMLANNVREMMAGVSFSDPSNGTQTFGKESGESGLATFNDVDDFDGFDSTVRADIASGQPVGPVDAARRVITWENPEGVTEVPSEWRNWRQEIFVDPVDANNLSVAFPKPNTSRTVVRITVAISYRAPGDPDWDPVVNLRWLKTR